jgi:hypothetical protein
MEDARYTTMSSGQGRSPGFRRRPLQVAALWIMAGRVAAGGDPLDAYAVRFHATKPPVHLEYRVAYRFLALEWRQLARAELEFTGGLWSNRVTGATLSAARMDLCVDSPDQPGQRSRASVHARLLTVMTLPDLQILFYGKASREYFNPVFGHRSESHDISLYDMESGKLRFWRTNCLTGEVTSELANAVALAKQSRQVLPTLTALRDVYRGDRPMLTPQDRFSVQVSIDDRVVPLLITTKRDRAPVRLAGAAPSVLRMEVAPEAGSGIHARLFRAWVVPYRVAATECGDDLLRDLSARATPEGLVPLAVDYSLTLGSVRCTLTGLWALTNAPASETSSRAEE